MVLNTYLLQPLEAYNSNARTLEALLLAVFAVYNLFRGSELEAYRQTPEGKAFYLVNAGVLLYFSASLFIFLSSSYTQDLSIETSRNIWTIHALLNIVYNGLLCAGLLTFWKTNSTFSASSSREA